MEIGQEVKSSFSSAVQKAHINVMFSANWLKNRVSETLKKYRVTPEQYNVLRILRGSHPVSMCVKDISGRMIERNSNTTRIIDKLEQKKFALRVPSKEDRREMNVFITSQGLELLEEIDGDFIIHQPDHCPLTEQDATILSNLLDKMRNKV